MTPLSIKAHERIMIFAPHPDDESLCSAGLILRALQRGASLRIIFLTNGESNPWPQRVAERRIKIDEKARKRWGLRRQSEALRALSFLGVEESCVSFWSYPDQGLNNYLLNNFQKISERVYSEIQSWRPSFLITPSIDDLHPDHNAFGLIAYLTLSRYKEMDICHLTYLTHNQWAVSALPAAVSITLSDSELVKKKRAIMCHASQMILSKKRFIGYAKRDEIFLNKTDDFFDSKVMEFSAENPANLQINVPYWQLPGAEIFVFLEHNLSCTISLPYWLKSSFFVSSSGAIREKIKFEINEKGVAMSLPMNLLKLNKLWVKLRLPYKFLDNTGWFSPHKN